MTKARPEPTQPIFQCAGEHIVGTLICYCQLQMGHKGEHIDYCGRKFKPLFGWTSAKNQHPRRKTSC